ncbi:uncharacterized protein [Phyllobates terribilis]|uniref:uncharacterized protein isoform X4 n=1 Tax=Phyllobates terribilis TaxID=111132 RepID=UPI003CCAFF06
MNRCDSESEPMDVEESNQNIQDNQNNCMDNEKMEKKNKRRVNREKQRENLVTSGNLFIIAFKNLLQKEKATKEVTLHYFERMTESLKPEDPDLFLKKLAVINESLWKVTDEEGNQPIANDFALTASVVTYCCVKDSRDAKVLKRAYGSSMSCKGKAQRQIMIAISTLHVWDKAISYAVCCAGKGLPITFPEQVHCNAYNLKTQIGGYVKVAPCTKCNKMYIVKFNPEYQAHNKKEDWMYGNCAENESLSRLLQSDRSVRENICIMGDNGETLMNWEDIQNKFNEKFEDEKKKTLKSLLSSRGFQLSSGEWKLFIPSCLL